MTTSNANDVPNPPANGPSEGKAKASSEDVKLFLPSVLGYEKIARGAAEALAEQIELPEERVEDLKTAVAEACMNAIEHGNNLERGFNVTVVMKISPEKLEVSVADVGEHVIPETFEPGSHPQRGWGMFLIRNLVDEMEISRLPEGGNEVRMAINLVPSPDVETKNNPAQAGEPAKAMQKVESQPKAVQPAEEKPKAVQPAEKKPKAVQPAEEKPKAVQPIVEKSSAITPATENAPQDTATPPTDHSKPASSSQQTPESLTSDATAPEHASSTQKTSSAEAPSSTETEKGASSDASSQSSSES